MKTRFVRIPGLVALLAGSLLLPVAAFSQSEPIATVENFGDSLVFTVIDPTGVAQVVLTVTGPCDFQFREVITKGQGVFRLDPTTIDGAYTYHLRREEVVDPEIVKVLQQARQLNDPETPRALCRDGKLPGPPAAQSAGFQVFRGKIIYDPGSLEKGQGRLVSSQAAAGATPSGLTGLADPSIVSVSSADFVILDDLIVDGSACIGFDCVNGESFGFDTIRIKENNLRIKFDDTSVAASFPRNDWQLTANDSANGGASKFSIDDISGGRTPFTVEANARSHSLYVDDGGRIGSRTSTPSVELHTIDGDTPTLRLQQDGSSGFAPQTWDVAGNETNFFVRDVTNGSQLPFRIRPDAPSSSIFIDVDGDVGLGTSSPDGQLHISRTGTVLSDIQSTDNGAVQIRMQTDSTNRRFLARDGSGNTESQIVFGDNGDFEFLGPTAVDVRMEIDSSGNMTVQGTLVTGGGGTCDPGPCDGVFDPTVYQVESIDQHAAYMWENRHLWGVGPTPEGAPLNLSKKTTGILHELEKAHIYIEQLHKRLENEEGQREELAERLEALEAKLATIQ